MTELIEFYSSHPFAILFYVVTALFAVSTIIKFIREP
jgi:hypothetical protein